MIGADLRPIEPVERYLAWLSQIERSPNTVRAYALDLKAYFSFLAARGVAWDQVTLEVLGEFTAWLRQPAENVVMLATARPHRSTSTVNRMLSAVAGFYDYHARNGVQFVDALVDQLRSGRGSYKPFCMGSGRRPPRRNLAAMALRPTRNARRDRAAQSNPARSSSVSPSRRAFDRGVASPAPSHGAR